MTIPVHPTDTIAFGVSYTNAAHTAVAGTVPTNWTAVDDTGNPFTGIAFNLQPFPNDEQGTATFTVEDGTFVLHAQLEGASFEAVSDSIDVSPDNTPTAGVVQVTVTPVA